jgi:uracil-DNA glycosylase
MLKNFPKINGDWQKILTEELNGECFNKLNQNLQDEEKNGALIFPPYPLIFSAFENTPFHKIKVVLIGQDPYHGPGQAHGLSFSVPKGIPFPPSLKNIFKEMKSDLNLAIPTTGDLTCWARQGVLLLNSVLTVKAGSPASHHNLGWENFTDAVIKKISTEKKGLVFLLWGQAAQKKETLIDASKHFILKAAHPSPFSAMRGFFGCKHFTKTNEILIKQGLEPIDWRVTD